MRHCAILGPATFLKLKFAHSTTTCAHLSEAMSKRFQANEANLVQLTQFQFNFAKHELDERFTMAELGWCVRVVEKLLDANHAELLIEFLLLKLFVLFLAYAILTLLPLQSAESIFFH